MKKFHGLNKFLGMSLPTILLGFGLSMAQDMDVQGDGSNASIIFQGKNINPSNSDKVGVQGYSMPNGYYGIGVQGIGGWKGVVGQAYGNANQGVGSRIGVYGSGMNGQTNYGIQGQATGTIGTNYGVVGNASGTNSRAGIFYGDLEYTGALLHSSDRKLKKNISEIRNCLNVITKLSPKEYEYRTDEFPTMRLPKSHQMGLVAQDVEVVMPELVGEATVPVAAPSPSDEEVAQKGNGQVFPKKVETYKTVDYVALIPVLVGAIKEQQEQIEILKKQLERNK